MERVNADFLVIGSGLAGLTYALKVAHLGKVALLTKKTRSDANSSWAQGGIAGVLSDGDSFELHKQDTLIAGAGLCDEAAVEILVHEGPERIRELIQMGANFNTERDAEGHEVLSLGREGGHSRNRIVHTADYTGWECERTLLEAVKSHPEIDVYEHFFVTDLILTEDETTPTCLGAYALDGETGEFVEFRVSATMLATGGCGQVYKHTTNPLVATGDGVAMAWRANVKIANMEFIQFHPTTLYHPEARAFLITEALRGEGGLLKHADGEAFMHRYHPQADLAPRDIVARAIVSEMKRRDLPCVYLDVRHLDDELIKSHFPTVYERCLSVGIDITSEPIPIVPAQHYQCGGVVTDLNGATDICRLYASGEVACTGVHGANRLASNSLLEAMVFAYRAARHTAKHACDGTDMAKMTAKPYVPTKAAAIAPSDLQEWRRRAKQRMHRNVGIVRSTAELQAALDELNAAYNAVSPHCANDVEVWETTNAILVGMLIIKSALLRKESRGLHYTLDYPELLESERHDTIVINNRSETIAI